MATAVIMPRQGNSVESCLIVSWKKQKGDPIAADEVLCEVETDKALVEVASPASGTVLALFFPEGAEVPVLTNIAAIGQPGEEVAGLQPDGLQPNSLQAEDAVGSARATPAPRLIEAPETSASFKLTAAAESVQTGAEDGFVGISPRARRLAKRESLEVKALSGSGPGGRIIERDVQAKLESRPKMTPLARTMVMRNGLSVPAQGSGVSGRVMAADLAGSKVPAPKFGEAPAAADEIEIIPVKGIRRLIAGRMLESLQTTAQLTLNATADARALLAYRQRLKASPDSLGVQQVTLNDLLLFAVSRTLSQYPELNALFADEAISRYKNVHLALAVDTPRGLMVPVIRQAQGLSLRQLSLEAKRLATACQSGAIRLEELNGGTFTVTNLGRFGIDSFTPVLNPPQVAILGVGGINLKPVEIDGQVEFRPHLGLSLTINHQVIDGAPGARFLEALSLALAHIDLLLAR